MTRKELLKRISNEGIPFVLVGGTALRMYNSPRVTYDIDLSVRITDADNIVNLLYGYSFFLVKAVKETSCSIALTAREGLEWVDKEKAGSVSFIQTQSTPVTPEISHLDIIAGSQIDILFELSVPFPRLLEHARTIQLEDFSFKVASPGDLISLKKARTDFSAADEEDIRFLEGLETENTSEKPD